MQTSITGSDEVGWKPYEVCKRAGAPIFTGHDHIYARSHLMSSVEHQTIVSTSNTLELAPGRTFVVVSGLGGLSARKTDSELVTNPWWASIHTERNRPFGVLFCTFYTSIANCYFKDIEGRIVDTFDLTNGV